MSDMEYKESYLVNFPNKKGTKTENSKREEALKNALDIRKFEIELYWKRAAYFWVFIAAAFVAYFNIATKGKKLLCMQDDLLLISAGVGFFMSLCWYCVGKGSKYWQENWEKHVDWLEDDVMGPLYKRVLAYKHGTTSCICPTKPYPFSVSKVNELLSFAICMVWAFLYIATIVSKIQQGRTWVSAVVITVFLFCLIYCLFHHCKTGCYKESDSDADKMHIRGDKSEDGYMDTEKILRAKNETLRIVGFFLFLFYAGACVVFVKKCNISILYFILATSVPVVAFCAFAFFFLRKAIKNLE